MSKGAVRRANPDRVISHWYRLIDTLNASSQDFYARLQQVLCERQVPGLESARIEWHEGGPLSPKRLYLRLKRERVVFDICAAPFGTGYFVSWRLGEKGLRVNLLGLLVLLAAGYAAAASFYSAFRFELMHRPELLLWAGGGAIGVFLLCFCLARSAVALGLSNLDALLLHTPIAAGFYERFLRPITYYRIDLALMYEEAVHAAVLQVVDELTDAQQLPRLSESDRRPVMRDFYKR